MRRSIFFGIFALLLMLPGFVGAATARNVTPDDAYSMISQRDGLYLLDVRTPGNFSRPGSKGHV